MAGFNRKGPLGEGPMTGRGLGRCNPKSEIDENEIKTDERPLRLGRRANLGTKEPGSGLRGAGRGLGRGAGRGQGRGRRN
ncbi:MAG: DUF5320 domain-containing protein [Bacteroidales bacterium]|nr:DUF5320 domain-containing protein [Bacteroidales bacterium]